MGEFMITNLLLSGRFDIRYGFGQYCLTVTYNLYIAFYTNYIIIDSPIVACDTKGTYNLFAGNTTKTCP